MKNLIIYDFDDTLFPTSLTFTPPKSWSFQVSQLIRTSQSYGHVIIITNASESWVRASWPQNPGITIVSARDQYEDQYPNNPTRWKKLAFIQQVRRLKPRHLVSIGDSCDEYVAAKGIQQTIRDVTVSTVKLRNSSKDLQQFEKQLVTIEQKLPEWLKESVSVCLAPCGHCCELRG